MQRNVSADNQIGAKVGDKVVINMPDFIDIVLSAKEHVIPVALGFISMLVVYYLFSVQLLSLGRYVPFIAQLISFLIVFKLTKAGLKKISYSNIAKPNQTIKIVEIVTAPNQPTATNKVKFG